MGTWVVLLSLLHVSNFILTNMQGIYNVKQYSLLSQCLASHVSPACQFRVSCILEEGRFSHIISMTSESQLLFGMTMPPQLQASCLSWQRKSSLAQHGRKSVSPSMPWTRHAIVRGSDKNVSAGEEQALTQPHGPVCVGQGSQRCWTLVLQIENIFQWSLGI